MAVFVYFTAIWYILYPFGTYMLCFWDIFPVLVTCTKKNLATLTETHKTALEYE
jgi:hypothetical protein